MIYTQYIEGKGKLDQSALLYIYLSQGDCHIGSFEQGIFHEVTQSYCSAVMYQHN